MSLKDVVKSFKHFRKRSADLLLVLDRICEFSAFNSSKLDVCSRNIAECILANNKDSKDSRFLRLRACRCCKPKC